MWAANKTGVTPFSLAALVSTPHSCTRARTVSVWPFWEARLTGVSPSLSATVASAPHSCTSARIVSVWPFCAVMKDRSGAIEAVILVGSV